MKLRVLIQLLIIVVAMFVPVMKLFGQVYLPFTVSGAAFATTPEPTFDPDPDTVIAFIGDSGDGDGFRSVLRMINCEGRSDTNADGRCDTVVDPTLVVSAVVHSGDFSYAGDSNITDAWRTIINEELGSSFPYLGSDGNHDNWSSYAPFFQDRLNSNGLGGVVIPTDQSNYAVTFKGIDFVFVQEHGNDDVLAQSLANATRNWKICSWHLNQRSMQIGGKQDEQGWGTYNLCLQSGAIMITGHEHSYERTRTITQADPVVLDTTCPDDSNTPNPDVCIGTGKSFVVVSGLGGREVRDQRLCEPTSFPYGCDNQWAKIYTAESPDSEGGAAQFGALFVRFNANNDPNHAHGYFKNISGLVIDEFLISSSQ